MIGILIMSHGRMAEGMLDSCRLFFGDELESVESLCLLPDSDIEQYRKDIEDKVKELDTGGGVIGLCDLFGGTPSNLCARMINDRFQIITGMNFPMLLELLGMRLSYHDVSQIDISSLMETSGSGIRNLNRCFRKTEN